MSLGSFLTGAALTFSLSLAVSLPVHSGSALPTPRDGSEGLRSQPSEVHFAPEEWLDAIDMQLIGAAKAHFAFDLIELDGEDVAQLPVLDRKERRAKLLKDAQAGIIYSEHEGGDGEAFRRATCLHGLEGVVSKRTDRPYLPGDRGA
jgi:hypothetical protein